MIDIKTIEGGRRVHYAPNYLEPKDFENGIVKAIGRSRDSVFVVYNCGGDWKNYQNYTGALTNCKDLYLGWREEWISLP